MNYTVLTPMVGQSIARSFVSILSCHIMREAALRKMNEATEISDASQRHAMHREAADMFDLYWEQEAQDRNDLIALGIPIPAMVSKS